MDYSFLRLTTDFNVALRNENFLTAKIIDNRLVQQFTDETFLQISNSPTDIAFAGNIKVELIDCAERVIQDITDVFAYDEFTDINGIKQIAFEFGNLGVDYGMKVLYLKLSHTVSDNVWYSSPFLITNYRAEETTRFDYKHNGYFKGISYDRANYYQSIRLRCFDNDIDTKEEVGEYTQMSGAIVSNRKTVSFIRKSIFNFCNNFIFNRCAILFSHDILFVNENRASNKPTMKKENRLGTSNFFALGFEWNPSNENQDFNSQQITL